MWRRSASCYRSSRIAFLRRSKRLQSSVATQRSIAAACRPTGQAGLSSSATNYSFNQGLKRIQPFSTTIDLDEITKMKEEHKESLIQLEQASRTLLQQSHIDPYDLESLLEQWHEALSQQEITVDYESAVARMDDLYQAWLQQQQQQQQQSSTQRPFGILLHAYSHTCPIGNKALNILETWNTAFMGDLEKAPQRHDYDNVLRAYAYENLNTSEAPHVAMEIVQMLQQWGFTMAPTLSTYQLAIRCVSKHILLQENEENVQEQYQQLQDYVKEVLQQQQDIQKESDKVLLFRVLSDAMQCSAVMMYHQSMSQELDPWLESVLLSLNTFFETDKLTRLLDGINDKDEAVQLVGQTVTAAQKIYDQCLDGSERAAAMESILEPLETVFKDRLPSSDHYYFCIKAWNEVKDATLSHQKIRNLLERMEDSHRRQITTLSPEETTLSYNHLMMAHQKAGHYNRVLGIWKEMTSSTQVRRNSISFGIIFRTLAAASSTKSASHALKAHSILKKMISLDRSRRHVQPDARFFGSVMVAWSRTRHPQAAEHCQEVFDLMEQEQQGELQPDLVHYASLMTAWGWSKDPNILRRVLAIFQEIKAAGMEPNVQCYLALFAAITRSHSIEGAMEAEKRLKDLEEQSLMNPDSPLHAHLYSSTMHAWINSGSQEAVDRCEALFERLQAAYQRHDQDPKLQPTCAIYVALMEAWTQSGRDDTPEKAIALLGRMQHDAAKGLAEPPDKRVYGSAMTACWKRGGVDAAEKVEEILKRMTQDYESGNAAAKPDVRDITILLHAWARSNAPNKATITWNLHNDMYESYKEGDLDMMPNAHSLSAVLNACAFTRCPDEEVRKEAVRIALMAMNEFDGDGFDGLNAITFNYLLKVIGHQIDDITERTRMASVIFQRCCQKGVVSSQIIRTLHKFVPELHRKLPRDSQKNLKLPSQWTRHAASKI